MSAITTKDGTQIYYNDWGTGQPIVFNHGWPLTADAFEDQMFFMASNGYRCVALDRRGHGRSDQTWHGNDMDAYADDLNELMEKLDPEPLDHCYGTTLEEVERTLRFALDIVSDGIWDWNIRTGAITWSGKRRRIDASVASRSAPTRSILLAKAMRGTR